MEPIAPKYFYPRKMCKGIMDLINYSKIPLTTLQVKNRNRKSYLYTANDILST